MLRRSGMLGLWAALLVGTVHCGTGNVPGPPVAAVADSGTSNAGMDAGVAGTEAGPDAGATTGAPDAGTASPSEGGPGEPSACQATPLCGPPERPCRMLNSEVLPREGREPFHGMVLLSLDPDSRPMVVYGPMLFDGTQLRHFAIRAPDGTWTERPLPFKYPSAFIHDAQGRGVALSYADDSSSQNSLWKWEGGSWTKVATFPGDYTPGTFVVDSHGRFSKLSQDATLVSFTADSWRRTEMGTPGKWQVYRNLALSPGDRLHFLYQEAADGVWLDRWVSPPAPAEQSPVILYGAQLAVTGGAPHDTLGQVHVLGWRHGEGHHPYELTYARRMGPNTWERFSLGKTYTSDPWDYCNRCRDDSCGLCPPETESLTAVAVLSNGCDDDVRLLYVRSWFRPSCKDLPAGASLCVGSRLELGWMTPAGVQTAALTPEWPSGTDGISAAVDRDGVIHVAFQDSPRTSPPRFHYRRIGPESPR